MKGKFKIAIVLIGIVALSLVEFAVMFWLGGKDVNNFCNEIKPGVSTAQLADLAKKHDIRLKVPGLREASGMYSVLAHTPRSFGRHARMVRHDNSAVIGSQYGYAD